MSAPRIVDYRQGMGLDCRFDMGEEELYAVKWYKDDQEFFRCRCQVTSSASETSDFRYMPPRQMSVFPVEGVRVDEESTTCGRSMCRVHLKDLTRLHSSGAYRCEVSSEAPTFRLAAESHNVTVVGEISNWKCIQV